MACLLGHFILSLGFAPGDGIGKNFNTSLSCHRINAYFGLLNFYALSSDMKAEAFSSVQQGRTKDKCIGSSIYIHK